MAAGEWVHLTPNLIAADPKLGEAIKRFRAPRGRAGAAAREWLGQRALPEAGHIATYVLVIEDEIGAFYSLGMGEVELRSQHRGKLRARHPRQGAVVILWLARSTDAAVDAEEILMHAVGIAQYGARRVGAAVIALDPFDEPTERLWRERFGFRASLTRRRDAEGKERARLWMPLFPEL